jgi:valyl-tRNA synthetase
MVSLGPEETDFFICLKKQDESLERILHEHGFIQDPDVLDTWFSSALWPHSTLGWPEQTPELAKWYPTSVLLTARDIITLWVARMVMMGMYNMGKAEGGRQKAENAGNRSSPLAPGSAGVDPAQTPGPTDNETAKQLGIPFFDVAINPTILDGKGERMSKSKGNGVDPVDVIDTYGADALRFTLATMATETQDVRMPVKKDAQGRNTSDKFDLGRNFCTKLWNAFRFAISNLESRGSESATSDLQPLTSNLSLPDRWIIGRFNQTVAEADAALKQYRFDVYARCCYDFFWRDFCDWYVEAIKPALRDPKRGAQSASVLAAVLDGALRLMHPIIPFITEILWWKLNEVRPARDLPGYISSAGNSPRLIKAAWPTVGQIDEPAQKTFPLLQEIIVAIRNVRNDYKVDAKKRVTISIIGPTELVGTLKENRELIDLLATAELTDAAPATDSARTSAAGCNIFIPGLVDVEAEKQRVTKQIAELEKKIAALEGRLNNPGYLAKAPPHLVEQTKQELEAAKAELAKLMQQQG